MYMMTETLAKWVDYSPMLRETGLNPRSSHTKDSKMVLDAALLNI